MSRQTRTCCIALALSFFFMMSGLGCLSAQAQISYDHKGLATQALENHIRPGYQQLREAMQGLTRDMDALCAAPSENKRIQARAAYSAAALAWAWMEHLRFGPVIKANRYERLAYWPDAKGLGRRQAARALRVQEQSVLDVASLARKSVALQGLTALEVVLYGKGNAVLGKSGGQEEAHKFRCSYGRAIAHNSLSISRDIEAAWSREGSFSRIWLNPGPDNPVYRNPAEVTLELMKAYRYGLELVREHKLIPPLGMRHPGQRPSRPQYAMSALSIPALSSALNGVMHLYAEGGLEQRLKKKLPDIAKLISVELKAVKGLLRKVALPGPEAFKDEAARNVLISTGFPLKNAIKTGGEALLASAGLTIGFNAGDGD